MDSHPGMWTHPYDLPPDGNLPTSWPMPPYQGGTYHGTVSPASPSGGIVRTPSVPYLDSDLDMDINFPTHSGAYRVPLPHSIPMRDPYPTLPDPERYSPAPPPEVLNPMTLELEHYPDHNFQGNGMHNQEYSNGHPQAIYVPPDTYQETDHEYGNGQQEIHFHQDPYYSDTRQRPLNSRRRSHHENFCPPLTPMQVIENDIMSQGSPQLKTPFNSHGPIPEQEPNVANDDLSVVHPDPPVKPDAKQIGVPHSSQFKQEVLDNFVRCNSGPKASWWKVGKIVVWIYVVMLVFLLADIAFRIELVGTEEVTFNSILVWITLVMNCLWILIITRFVFRLRDFFRPEHHDLDYLAFRGITLLNTIGLIVTVFTMVSFQRALEYAIIQDFEDLSTIALLCVQTMLLCLPLISQALVLFELGHRHPNGKFMMAVVWLVMVGHLATVFSLAALFVTQELIPLYWSYSVWLGLCVYSTLWSWNSLTEHWYQNFIAVPIVKSDQETVREHQQLCVAISQGIQEKVQDVGIVGIFHLFVCMVLSIVGDVMVTECELIELVTLHFDQEAPVPGNGECSKLPNLILLSSTIVLGICIFLAIICHCLSKWSWKRSQCIMISQPLALLCPDILNFDFAVFLSAMAKAAYCVSKKRMKALEEFISGYEGLKHLRTLECERTSAEGFIASYTDRVTGDTAMFVVFAGTSSARDWCLDLKVWRKRLVHRKHELGEGLKHFAAFTNFSDHLKKNVPKAKMHAGFRSQAMAVQSEVMETLSRHHFNQLYIVGHSLGGAVSVVMAMHLKASNFIPPSVPVIVATFGAPRVGNRAFQQVYDKLVPWTFQFVNIGDPIPRTPCGLYVHVGQSIQLADDRGAAHTKLERLQRMLKTIRDTFIPKAHEEHKGREYTRRLTVSKELHGLPEWASIREIYARRRGQSKFQRIPGPHEQKMHELADQARIKLHEMASQALPTEWGGHPM